MSRIIKIFVGSPSDVSEERLELESIVTETNTIYGDHFGIKFDLVKWETHSYPAVDVDAQAALNKQLSNYDVFIGILWKRLGTPTERAESGTVEEFEIAYNKYKDGELINIMLYFNNSTPALINEIDPKQLESVFNFKDKIKGKGIYYFEYSNMEEFQRNLRTHLGQLLIKISKETESTGELKPTEAESMGESESTEAESMGESESTEAENITEPEIETLGLIDLIEMSQNNFKITTSTLSKMTVETENLGKKVEQRTSILTDQEDISIVKKVFNEVSDDLNFFSDMVNPEISIFSKSYADGINNIIAITSLWVEFSNNDKTELINIDKMLDDLETSINGSIGGISSLEDAIENAPPFSVKFIRSKNRALETVKKIINEFNKAYKMTSDARKTVKFLISDSLSKDEKMEDIQKSEE